MPTLTAGQIAEQLVEDRVRAALPQADGYRVFANVAWTGRTRDHGQLTDGEADLVIAHPERGFLVVETKSGEISRDAAGRWWAGRHELNPDPFAQAQRSLRALLRKLDELPDRPADFRPLAGHAVALPDVDLAMGHAPDAPTTVALREEGRAVEIIEAAPGAETIEAVRRVLHRLRAKERVHPWEIAVLVGGSLEKSAVWAVRGHVYGNEALWNGQVDDAGRTIGLAASAVPEPPSDVIVCDSIRRFKGLERPVIVLCELDPADKRHERLLYVGASRARQHLVVITPPRTEV